MEPQNIVCVILCGGKGKRMRSIERHKVCFPIAGQPAINRTIVMLKSVGLRQFLLVVGTMAEQVIATVATEHPEASFVYQAQPRGTGHAVACALEPLKAAGYTGRVLVTMGDKVIQPAVVRNLLRLHEQAMAALTLAALPKSVESSAGRIVMDRAGKPIGIVEVADIRRSEQTGKPVIIGPRRLSARQVEAASGSVNASLYLFEAPALYEAAASLRDNNAQGELYLTDTLKYLWEKGAPLAVLDVPNPDDLMAYNTPEELLAIEQVFKRRMAGRPRISAAATASLTGKSFRTAAEWLKLFSAEPPKLRRALTEIYGPDDALRQERRAALVALLKRFVKLHGGGRKIVLARAPGRINLMGRHVDHRGGYVNVMAISREVILAASPRQDDLVSLSNLKRQDFPDRSFRVSELLRSADWCDWMDFLNSATVRQVLEASRGDWSNYAKAAVLRLQHASPEHRLAGMDCLVSGDIPMGAGLSSSSAIVVAVAEAAVALNGLAVTTQQFVDLCGEGEWFVGSRGGSADHAAIRSGQRGCVARVGFFPFRIEETIDWPEELSLVIANSHIRAAKSAGARDTFNQRVACYNLAELLLRRDSAVLASMQHLRDANPEALGVSPAEIYRALKRLPQQLSRRAARRLLGAHAERLETIFATHADIGSYRLRDVTMFGMAECRRSDMFAPYLRAGQFEQVGLLMQISHDGDRVVRWKGAQAVPFKPSYGGAQLERLIADVSSGHPARQASAALWAQPGRYACSTPEIDFIVDSAMACPGVIGAQVAGAGLGGCAMILAYTDSLEALLAALKKSYYQPRELECEMHVCRPVRGSGILSV